MMQSKLYMDSHWPFTYSRHNWQSFTILPHIQETSTGICKNNTDRKPFQIKGTRINHLPN